MVYKCTYWLLIENYIMNKQTVFCKQQYVANDHELGNNMIDFVLFITS